MIMSMLWLHSLRLNLPNATSVWDSVLLLMLPTHIGSRQCSILMIIWQWSEMKRSMVLLEWDPTQRTIVTWTSMSKWISPENCALSQKIMFTGCVNSLRKRTSICHTLDWLLGIFQLGPQLWEKVVRNFCVVCYPIFYFYLYSIEWFFSYIIVMKENKNKNTSFSYFYFFLSVLENSPKKQWYIKESLWHEKYQTQTNW